MSTEERTKFEIPFAHILLVCGFTKSNHSSIYENIVDLILLFYAKPLSVNLQYNKHIKQIAYCPINDNWSSMVEKMRHGFKLSKHYTCGQDYYIHLQYDNKLINASNWKNYSHQLHITFTVIAIDSLHASNVHQALNNEYNPQIAATFMEYYIDECFDDEAVSDDILEVTVDDMDICLIHLHLVETFPHVFNTTVKQEHLLKTLQNGVNGILQSTFIPLDVNNIQWNITKKEAKDAVQLLDTLCPHMFPGGYKYARSIYDVIAIGLKNDIPLLNWLTDTLCRYRVNQYINYGQNKHISDMFGKYKLLSRINKISHKAADTLRNALNRYFRKNFNMIQFSPICVIDDNINEFAMYYIAMNDVINCLTKEKHINILPCQIDMMIIPKNVTVVRDVLSQEMSDDSLSICDEKEDIFDEIGSDVIGSIVWRLNANNWTYTKNVVTINGTDSDLIKFKRFLTREIVKQTSSKRNQRIIIYIDRRNPKCTEFNEYEYISNVENGWKLLRERKQERKLQKKTWKDTLYITQPKKKKICKLCNYDGKLFRQRCFWLSQDCMLPKVNKTNIYDIGCRNDLHGYQFTLSWHIESENNIRCYWFMNSTMTRLLPFDVYKLWPKYFLTTKNGKMQSLNKDLVSSLQSMKQINDIGFQYWYEQTTGKKLIEIL